METEMFRTVCKEPSVLKCKRCLGVYYCGQKCQKIDWINHKQKCNKELYNVIQRPNLKVCLSKSKTTKKETNVQERFQCKACNTSENLHIQRFLTDKGTDRSNTSCSYVCTNNHDAVTKKNASSKLASRSICTPQWSLAKKWDSGIVKRINY